MCLNAMMTQKWATDLFHFRYFDMSERTGLNNIMAEFHSAPSVSGSSAMVHTWIEESHLNVTFSNTCVFLTVTSQNACGEKGLVCSMQKRFLHQFQNGIFFKDTAVDYWCSIGGFFTAVTNNSNHGCIPFRFTSSGALIWTSCKCY